MKNEDYIFSILNILVKLEINSGNKNISIDDFKDVGLSLLKLPDNKLKEIYNEIAQISINTYKIFSNDIYFTKNKLNKKIENEEKNEDMKKINNFNF